MPSNMTISWFWLVAQFCMSLILPSALAVDEYSPSNQNLLSVNGFSRVKRQTMSCTSVGASYCGYVCCDYYNSCYPTSFGPTCCTSQSDCPGADSVSSTVFIWNSWHQLDNKAFILISLTYEQPCNPPCPIGSTCSIDNYFYASCVLDPNYTPAPTPTYNNEAASTTPYDAAITPYDTDEPSPTDSYASSTSEESPLETEHHRSSKVVEAKPKKLPPKAISGIVIGVVAFFAALGGAWTWLFRRRKRRSSAPEPGAPANPPEEHHAPPEYFKQPEPQVYQVSQ